jgi:GNAT superfamily N-acetyltransferase
MSDFPNEARFLAAMDATWSPAEMRQLGPWIIRRGDDGGKRVSAATSDAPVSEADIEQAEAAMTEMGQPKIFMLRGQNDAMDQTLAARGYKLVDPVVIFAAPAAVLAEINPAPLDAIPCTEPLALMQEMWKTGGIREPRFRVMDRTGGPKTYLFSRYLENPGGVAFVASDNQIAMLHALEVNPDFRRFGVARNLLGKAAIWAIEQGAQYLSVVTTSKNLPARRLFTGLGMQVVGKYHYRMK